MSRWSISGAPIPAHLPFAHEITQACAAKNFPPCFAWAIKGNETALSTDPKQMQGGTWPGSDYLTNAAGTGPDTSQNAGHGPYQLTAKWPSNWDDPLANALYAIENFLLPAVDFWTANGFSGDELVRAAAASYNAGPLTVWGWHVKYNDVDHATTDRYGARCLQKYNALVNGTALVFP